MTEENEGEIKFKCEHCELEFDPKTIPTVYKNGVALSLEEMKELVDFTCESCNHKLKDQS